MTKDFISIGAAVYDITGRLLSDSVNERDSNPSRIYSSCGGVGRNIVENAARLGIDSSFISVLGTDAFSSELRKSCENVGVDLSHCYTHDGAKPCVYINLIERQGELLFASSDLDSVESTPPEFFAECMPFINRHRLVCLDTNLVEAQLLTIAENCQSSIIADTVSIAKAPRIRPILKYLSAIKTNIGELGALTDTCPGTFAEVEKACHRLLDSGIKQVFVTMGNDGAFCVDSKGCERIDAIETEVVSVTGVGDAFGAGVAYGILRGLSTVDTLLFGTAMSHITLKCPHAVSKDVSEAAVLQLIERWSCA